MMLSADLRAPCFRASLGSRPIWSIDVS